MKSIEWKKIVKDLKGLGVERAEVEFSDGGSLKVVFVKQLPKKPISVPMDTIRKDVIDEDDLYYST